MTSDCLVRWRARNIQPDITSSTDLVDTLMMSVRLVRFCRSAQSHRLRTRLILSQQHTNASTAIHRSSPTPYAPSPLTRTSISAPSFSIPPLSSIGALSNRSHNVYVPVTKRKDACLSTSISKYSTSSHPPLISLIVGAAKRRKSRSKKKRRRKKRREEIRFPTRGEEEFVRSRPLDVCFVFEVSIGMRGGSREWGWWRSGFL